MATKIKRFEINDRAHETLTCVRCLRKMRAGESAVAQIEPGLVSYRHAGRSCPPCVVTTQPDPRLRVVQRRSAR